MTLLFTDIVGSTALWEQHPEAMRLALLQHDALLRQTIETHHGEVFKTVGDAFCAAFPTASDALAAAVAAQLALQELNQSPVTSHPFSLFPLPSSLKVRMALHSGTVEQREGDYFGSTVNRVARLLQIGQGDPILLSAATRELLSEKLPTEVALQELGRHRLSGVEQPMSVYAVRPPDLPQEFLPLLSLDAQPTNLAVQLTSFIGRDQEMAEVSTRLSQTRLLTLTGAGGCGKTRLALQVAVEVLEEYPGGVWLVELAALSDPSLVPQRVLQALGGREQPGRSLTETLIDHLRSTSLLLMLDNCEHLVEAGAQLVETLLHSCPKLKILATSREALKIAGEQPWRVPPLAHPANDPLSSIEKELPSLLLEYDACRLLVQRARVQRPELPLTRSNSLALVQLCQHLDGMPLAIELAAARVRSLTVEQIAARLDDRFRLLTGGSRTVLPRQQTLRAHRLELRLADGTGAAAAGEMVGVCWRMDTGGSRSRVCG